MNDAKDLSSDKINSRNPTKGNRAMQLTASDIERLVKVGVTAEALVVVAKIFARNIEGETVETPKSPRHETSRKRKPSVSSTERVRKYRQKMRGETPDETPNETPETVSETVVSPTPPSLPSLNPVSEVVLKKESKEVVIASARPKRQDTRLPEDFEPDESCIKVARELHFNKGQWKAALENFKDYWRSAPGSRGLKRDWQATFRNSLRDPRNAQRNGLGNARGNANGRDPQKHSSIEGVNAALQKFRELNAGNEGSFEDAPGQEPSLGRDGFAGRIGGDETDSAE